jgi:hypothetical protein
MHSKAPTPPRYGGSIRSSSMKSETQSIKSERPPSVKSERPPSVKSEPRNISLPGSSVGSSSVGSRTSYGSIGSAPSGRTSYGGVSSVGSNQTPRRQASTNAYLELARGRNGSSKSGSMSNVTSFSSSRTVSVDAENLINNSYRPTPVAERPRRDDVLRAGRTVEVPEKKRPGYAAGSRARRRV